MTRSIKKPLSAGDKASVLLSANRKCYNPTCNEQLVVFRDGVPIVNFQYAHIRDELPPPSPESDQGWRYYPDDLTQEQRNHHSNIILLCDPCHKLIDKINPRQYSVELLHEWKTESESESAPLAQMLGGLDLDLLQSLVDTAAPRDHSFPFIDYRIIGQPPYNNPTNPIVTPFLSVCGSTPLSATSYHVSIAQKTINIFNLELCKSSTPIQYVAGAHYQLNGFPLRICWDHEGAVLSIHAVITSITGTFTQNTTVNVTQGIPTICSQHSSVSFDNGSTCGSQLIYTRSHDLDGTPSHEQFHQNGWAISAHKPLYDNRL